MNPLSLSEMSNVTQLQQAYEELCIAYKDEVQTREHLQKAFDEQQVMVRHQQKLFAMVKELYGEQVQVASSDPLTGLPNHRALISKIDEAILHAEQSQHPCSLLFVDLDRFKSINDTYGHRAGDSVLQEVGRRLRQVVRQGDEVGRYGGEEFALILRQADLDIALQVAERLRVQIASQTCTWESEETGTIVEIPITTSIGIATYRIHADTRDAMLEAADQAMYAAKHGGRNRVCVATLMQKSA
jgi:diguanylate cyclase (GGDEF)-like protein